MTIIPAQPNVKKGAKKYLLASKQALIVGYLQLTPPTRNFDKKSNAVQGISHRMPPIPWLDASLTPM